MKSFESEFNLIKAEVDSGKKGSKYGKGQRTEEVEVRRGGKVFKRRQKVGRKGDDTNGKKPKQKPIEGKEAGADAQSEEKKKTLTKFASFMYKIADSIRDKFNITVEGEGSAQKLAEETRQKTLAGMHRKANEGRIKEIEAHLGLKKKNESGKEKPKKDEKSLKPESKPKVNKPAAKKKVLKKKKEVKKPISKKKSTFKKKKTIEGEEHPEDKKVKKSFDNSLFKAQPNSSAKKLAIVMKEFKAGTLKTEDGKKVTDRKQAMAIVMSKVGLSKK